MQHEPITHLRILFDDSIVLIPPDDPLLKFACGEEVSLDPYGREPDAEIVCQKCAKQRGYEW